MKAKMGLTVFIETLIVRPDLIGVTIGFSGIRTEHILAHLSIAKLVVVDPFEPYPEIPATHLGDLEKWENHLMERYLPRSNVFHMAVKSVTAAKKFKKNSLDFVYIDGSHAYEDVALDLVSWFPKLRPDGVFAGHDYNLESVKKAVDEFAQAKGLTVLVDHPMEWMLK